MQQTFTIDPYQQQQEAANRRLALAQSMQQMAMKPQQGVASPAGAIGQILQAYMAAKATQGAEAGIADLTRKQQDTNKADMANVMRAYRGDTQYQNPDMVFDQQDAQQNASGWYNQGQGRDRQAMLDAMLASNNPQFQNLAMTTMLKPETTGMPANVQEWQYYSNLPPEEQERYLSMKRGGNWLNLGGSFVNPSQVQPGNVQAEIAKTLPPEQTPEVRGAQTAATEQAKVDVERPKIRKAAESAMNDLERQAKIVSNTIDEALGLISPWSTGWGTYLSGLPETDAGKLNNALDTIKANIGFDKLQRLRDNSPTGGALGQVSEMENRLLQAVNGALDPKQSDQLQQNLQTIKELYGQVLAEKKAAFAKDFGRIDPNEFPAEVAVPSEPSMDPAQLSDDDLLRMLNGR